ncbi:hypothetical protein SRB5_15840 [Streptomyces sp. RB5]|uniref:Uncharacterized protein n=1 Tax=Streptomyces smaragdinus TaxID=2585196 RepID=A0A7K0CDK9_9ACTN|nr:hypothetical protein [Streptomyces smaragdinus]MQY11466.1 hypothetical protein [Streptomyces smaragdinus]
MANAERAEITRLARRIADLERLVARGGRTARLAYSSMESGAIEVYQDDSLRAIIGEQADGSTGITAVNGTAPPTPNTPVVTPVIGGLQIEWDGTFTDALVAPLDLARIQVHVLNSAGTDPDVRTPAATIEAPSGASVTVPVPDAYDERYVKLIAVNTSGIPGPASAAVVGVAKKVTDTDLHDGSITTDALALGAVTGDRLAVSTDGENLILDPSFEGMPTVQRLARLALPNWTLLDGGNGTAKALRVDAGTAHEFTLLDPITAVPGQRMFLAADYCASTDWAGDRLSLYAEWRDAAGTPLAWGAVNTGTSATTVRGAWTRLAGVTSVAAPTGTAQVVVRIKNTGGTAGTVLWDNAVARYVSASAASGARAELSPMGLQLFDSDGDEAVALVTGRPNYLTLSADGVAVATIDQEGKAGLQALYVAETLSLGGEDLESILDERPRGVIAYGRPTNTVTSTGTEIGYYELPARIQAGRMYRIAFLSTADFDTANNGEARVYLRDGGASTPTISSPIRQMVILTASHTGNYWTAHLEHVTSGTTLGTGLHRFLLTFQCSGGSTGQTMELGLVASGRSPFFVVEDIGPETSATGVYNTGGGTSEPPVQQYTKTYSASWSGSYAGRSSYNSYYGNTCMQGYYSATNGMQASLIGFPAALSTDLSGATIKKVEIYLYFDHWYYNAGGTAVIKAHRHASRPSTFSCDSEAKSISWAKNQGKWVDITSVFDSTTWRGIALDPNNSSYTYYGRARGLGQTNAPKLRVTYVK